MCTGLFGDLRPEYEKLYSMKVEEPHWTTTLYVADKVERVKRQAWTGETLRLPKSVSNYCRDRYIVRDIDSGLLLHTCKETCIVRKDWDDSIEDNFVELNLAIKEAAEIHNAIPRGLERLAPRAILENLCKTKVEMIKGKTYE